MKKIPVSFFIHKNDQGSLKTELVPVKENFYGIYGTKSVDVIITERDEHFVKADVIMVNDVNANNHLCEVFVKWDDQVNVTMDDYMNDKVNISEISHLLNHVVGVLCRYIERYDDIEDIVADPKWNGYFYTGQVKPLGLAGQVFPTFPRLPMPIQTKTWMDVLLGMRKVHASGEEYVGMPNGHILVSSSEEYIVFRRLLTDWLHKQIMETASPMTIHVYMDCPHQARSEYLLENCVSLPNNLSSYKASLRMAASAGIVPMSGDFAVADTTLYMPNMSETGNKKTLALAHMAMEVLAVSKQTMLQLGSNGTVPIIRGVTEKKGGNFCGVPETLKFMSTYSLRISRAVELHNGHYVEVEVGRNKTGPSGIIGAFFVPRGCQELTAEMLNFGAACRFSKVQDAPVPVACLPGYGDVTWEHIVESDGEHTYALWAMASYNQSLGSLRHTHDLPNQVEWMKFVADKDYCREDFTFSPVRSIDSKESFLELLGLCSLWSGGIENANAYRKKGE
ncbi:hypothetical protein [Vibrio phage vB_VmeM-Yong XC32]|nr:hypothetical protein [Vibrio phage vB_VmeM-Yong XC31]QAX96508.1 hypothetical protein [Vibrio phage vB_VmeM-Yong XC32]QAX96825.1 hypothetical protein [Vibrio phage vB_VmeM-Yong MS31]